MSYVQEQPATAEEAKYPMEQPEMLTVEHRWTANKQEELIRPTLAMGRIMLASVLLTAPNIALAQDNVAGDTASAGTNVTNNTIDDPSLDGALANDLGTANDLGAAPLPTDDMLSNDMALANSVEPRREDEDFPWGLLGLLGLAGLMGRKKDPVYVDNRTDRRDV